jgi:hypothetical protein
MFKMNSLVSRCVLALAVLTGSAAAVAGPTYHVDIDGTSTTGNGYLVLSFLSFDPSGAAHATVTNWSGFGGTGSAYNDATLDLATRTLGLASGANGYFFDAVFGSSHFGFDVRFDVDTVPVVATFGAALSDLDGNYLGNGDLVDITLAPDQPVQVTADAAYASVAAVSAAVPEPSALLSMVTGLGLLGLSLRRRMR